LSALQSKQFKAEDNIYNALNLSVPEIKDTVVQSFSKNSKGCSFDPLFSSNFCSGNMMAVIRVIFYFKSRKTRMNTTSYFKMIQIAKHQNGLTLLSSL